MCGANGWVLFEAEAKVKKGVEVWQRHADARVNNQNTGLNSLLVEPTSPIWDSPSWKSSPERVSVNPGLSERSRQPPSGVIRCYCFHVGRICRDSSGPKGSEDVFEARN